VAAARKQWDRETAPAMDRRGQPLLFAQAELDRLDGGPVQQSLFDLSDITDTQFFEQAESKVIDALRRYAEGAQNGQRLQRRLFAEDAVQGFAFVDLCQERYDVVLMNPPFGDASMPSQSYIQDVYADTKGDVYKSFIECFQDRLVPSGFLGMISSRSGFFLGQSADWRERIVLRLFRPTVLADFGFGVLDAMVETAAYVLKNIDETEDEQLTLRLLTDVTAVETDTAGRFSIPKYQRQRGGLKRHQATSELRRLLAAGYLVEVPGSFRRFRADRQVIAQAPRPAPVSLPALLCFRLFGDTHKDRTLIPSVESVRSGQIAGNTFLANLSDLSQVPGSPFAYWVSNRLRRLFREFPPFEGKDRTVKQGLATADDFRFVRCWWEVPPEQMLDAQHGPHWRVDLPTFQVWCRQRTCEGKRWVPFAKGGEYSPFYADLHLVVNWDRDGEEIKNFFDPITGRTASRPQNIDFYFRPGLTWPLRSQRGFNLRAYSSGAVFGHKGPSAFVPNDHLLASVALMNSLPLNALISLQVAFGSYEVGVIQRTPVALPQDDRLARLARQAVDRKRHPEQANELNHLFVSPYLDDPPPTLNDLQTQIDTLACDLYGLTDADRAAIQNANDSANAPDASAEEEAPFDLEQPTKNEDQLATHPAQLTKNSLSHSLGCLFGRWDIRYAMGERLPPPLPDPFDPLPVCPPGMLQHEDGLPQTQAPPSYPLCILRDGLLVDDPEHSNDIVRQVRDVSEVVGKECAAAIEKAVCERLGVSELRDYFRKPGKRGFWDDHISRYSKSRRKAPIYWLLQSSKKNYAIWLYYHRLDKDILSKALVNYVEPKLRLETTRLETLLSDKAAAGESSKDGKRLAKDAERQEDFLSELREFEDKLRRAANLHLDPDLNDGVVLNIAPLHELVPWKEAKKYWDELLAGKYAWSSIGKQLREKGLVH
jgi:hypothetical protein